MNYPTDKSGRPRGGRSHPRHAARRGYQAGAGQPAYFGDGRYHPGSARGPGNSGNAGNPWDPGRPRYPMNGASPAHPESQPGYAGDRRLPGHQPGVAERGRTPLPSSPPASTGSGGTGRWRAFLRAEWPLAVFCSCVAAIALLYNLFGAPDVLYDEAAYVFMAKQVALQGQLTLTNQPMFIHPPLMWLLEAGWLRLTGYASAPEPSAIYAARLLSASVGAIAAASDRCHGLPVGSERYCPSAQGNDWRGHATRSARPRPRAL